MDPEFALTIVGSMACMLQPFDPHVPNDERDSEKGGRQAVHHRHGH